MGTNLATTFSTAFKLNTLKLKFTKYHIWQLTGFAIIFFSLLLPLFATQSFWFGYYYQSAPVMVTYWAIGFFASCWLIWTSRYQAQNIQVALTHPIVWAVGLYSLFNFCISIFHPSPVQTMFGSPQMGEGAINYLIQSLLAAVIIISFKNITEKTKNISVGIAVILGGIFCVLTFVGCQESPFAQFKYWKWASYYFPDFLGYITVSFIAYYGIYWQKLKLNLPKNMLNYKHILFNTILFAVFYVLTYMTKNKAVWYGNIIAVVSIIAAYVIFKKSNKMHIWLATICLLMATAFVILFANLHYIEDKVPSTIVGRGVLVRYGFLHHFANFDLASFKSLLFGDGYGIFSDLVMKNLFGPNEISLFNGEELDLTRESLNRDFFHSHNRLTEVFISVGILGIAAFLATYYYIIRSFNSFIIGGIFFISYLLLDSFWFQLSVTIPYVVLGFCLLSTPYYPFNSINLKFVNLLLRIVTLALLIIAVGCFFMAKEMKALSKIEPDDDLNLKINQFLDNKYVKLDKYFGNKRTTILIRSMSVALLNYEEYTPHLPIKEVLTTNLRSADHLYESSNNCTRLESCAVALNIYSESATHERTIDEFAKYQIYSIKWRKLAQVFYSRAKSRSDMLVPILNYLVIRNKYSEVWELINPILVNNPEDAVGLWYSGTLKLADDNTAYTGILELNRALDNGVGRFMPIPKADIESLRQAREQIV